MTTPDRAEQGTDEPHPLTGKKKLLFYGLFFLLLAFATLLLSELALRLTHSEEEINGNYWGRGAFEASDPMGFRHKPGYTGSVTRPGSFRASVSIHRAGLRQDNLDEQLQLPETVLILGDSFAFGLGVEERSSFASLIQEDLNPLGVGILNGAQTGYSVEQEHSLGVILARELEPDSILLSLYPQNDVRGDYEKRYRNIDVAYGYRLPKDRGLPGPFVDFFRTHSYLWMFWSGRGNQARARDAIADYLALARAEPEKMVQPSLEALDRLHDFCRENQIRFGVMIIPPRNGKNPFDDLFRSHLAERGIPTLDLGAADLTPQDYFAGDGHWNEEGHRKAAKHLAPFLQQLIERNEESGGPLRSRIDGPPRPAE